MSSGRSFALSLTHDKVAEVREAFDLIDEDGDGVISKSELTTMLRSLGFNPSEDELKVMMREADVDENGSIDFKEFLTLMVKTPEQSHDPRLFKNGSGGFTDSVSFTSSSFGSNLGIGSPFDPQALADGLLSIFELDDPEASGWVDKSVFVRTMSKCGDALNDNEMTELMNSGILKQDHKGGKVNYRRFIETVAQLN